MRVDAFDFDLPEDRIALRPAVPRDAARLLCVEGASLVDRLVRDLPERLRAGDLLVVNDSKVIPAQLQAVRAPRADEAGGGPVGGPSGLLGAKVGLTLHKRVGSNVWLAFARPAKKLEPGDRLTVGGALGAYVKSKEGGEVTVAFDADGGDLDRAIAQAGLPPLPPYIASRRPADARDTADYQTVYAKRDGSVAAPTAGLHFTDELLKTLDAKGIGMSTVTLHVGAGTFLPVKSEDTADHVMHSEWGTVSEETARRIAETRAAGGRIVAVGTTSLRLLEWAAAETGAVQPKTGETDLFITPGYRFKAVDLMMTNFHLPKSTLFMLVCAFAGFKTMHRAYAHAIREGYRFYSYGDSSLLTRAEDT